uniref:Transposase (Putative), gypsy type n=1 Tax=Tanacetum cinerariifolium TaxID=118510 RepID=A0A699HKU7_TANCI|nr:hypothetical protein [Tanacetum cinerariifolium]
MKNLGEEVKTKQKGYIHKEENKKQHPSPCVVKAPKETKTKVADAGEPSHPAKNLKDDYEAPGGPTVGGKSQSSIQRLFTGAVQNAEVRGGIMPTLPFVLSFVSTTPERVNITKSEVDYVVKTSMPIITSATTTAPTADPAAIAKEKLVGSSVFGADSPSAGESHPISGGFFDCSGSNFLVRGIRTVSNLHKVYVPQWNVTNGSCLDNGGVCREMVDEFAPPKFFASIHGMDHDQLFTEFNVGVARQISLSAEERMRAKYHIKEKRRLKVVVEEKNQVLKARDEEIKNLKAKLLLKEAEVAEAIRLRAKTSKLKAAKKSLQDEVTALNERNTILEKDRNALDVKVTDLQAIVVRKDRELTDSTAQLTSIKSHNDNLADQVYELQVSSSELKEKLSNYENLMERLEEFQDAQLKVVNDKFDKLYADFVEVTLHLEERFYPHLLTTIAGRRWLLTHGMKIAIAKCLNSPEYLFALGTTVSKAIEKGMQDGLAAGIIHGRKGHVLTDVAAHNPTTEADYVSALQQLQSVNFSLLAEHKANKDASIKAVMNIMRLEEHLAARLGLNELQPHADQLMVPIYHSSDKNVVGASSLSLALYVLDAHVWRIRENIISHGSLSQDVFVPLADPLSDAALTGTEDISGAAPATADLTTALSVTLTSAGTVAPLFVDDYGVMGTDDQSAVNESVIDEDANPLPNVDDAELNIPQ